MSRRPAPPRQRFLRIQKALVARGRRVIAQSLGGASRELRAYELRYHAALRGGRRRFHSVRELVARLGRADLVFQGEYVTLQACQRSTVALLRELGRRRELVLALDAAPVESQCALDAYVGGAAGELAIHEALGGDALGSVWQGYAPLFRLAREHELQLYALGSSDGADGPTLEARDESAAELLVRAAVAHPDALVYVLAPDFRIARCHLPARTRAKLRALGLERVVATLHQNVDSLYWETALAGLRPESPILEIGPDEYCAFTSSPLDKYHSYLRWELDQPDLGGSPEASLEACFFPSREHVERQLHRIVRAIARFLGLDPARFNDFKVYAAWDLDFLADLRSVEGYSRTELREVESHLRKDESYFLTRGNIIYLSDLSIDHAAEEAAHYVNNKLSPHEPGPLPPRSDFYLRAIKEALGFLGSKVINPDRRHHGLEDFEELAALAAVGPVDARTEALGEVAAGVLRHRQLELDVLGGGRRPADDAPFARELDLHLGIAHALGYILGEKLHQGLAMGAIQRPAVRTLFSLPLSGPEDAEILYFELLKTLQTPQA